MVRHGLLGLGGVEGHGGLEGCAQRLPWPARQPEGARQHRQRLRRSDDLSTSWLEAALRGGTHAAVFGDVVEKEESLDRAEHRTRIEIHRKIPVVFSAFQ